MRHMLGTTFVWLLLMIGHAGASPITTGVFFPRDETATAVLADNFHILCTTTAIDFSCGLLSINATNQATVGSTLVFNVLPTDIVAARLTDNRALVCYSTDTEGKCVVVDATVTNGVQLSPSSGSFTFPGGGRKLSLELNAHDLLLCYVKTSSTFCGIGSTSQLSEGLSSILSFNERSVSDISISIIPSTNRFLVCYVVDVGNEEETDPGWEIKGVGKCSIVAALSSTPPRQLTLVKSFFLFGSNPVVTHIGHVVFQPPTSSLPFVALVCFTIESFDFEEGGLCTAFELNRFLFSATAIATETFSFASEISAVVVKNILRGAVSEIAYFTALVCYVMVEENCMVVTYNQLLGLLSTSDSELSMPSNKQLFTINDAVIAGVSTSPTPNEPAINRLFNVRRWLTLDRYADALANVSNVSVLNSFVCAEILFGDLDEQRYCVAQTTSISSSIALQPTTKPTSYCVLPAEWMCNARTDACSWINGACRPKSFCQVSQGSECQNLVEIHGHSCLWEVSLTGAPTKQPTRKRRRRKSRGLEEEDDEPEQRDLQTNGKCTSTVPPRSAKDYCPELTVNACLGDKSCKWFIGIGCRGVPFCNFDSKFWCSSSPGCEWIGANPFSGVCGTKAT